MLSERNYTLLFASTLFHSHEVLGQAKSMHQEKYQNSAYLSGGEMTGKGHEETFWNILLLLGEYK